MLRVRKGLRAGSATRDFFSGPGDLDGDLELLLSLGGFFTSLVRPRSLAFSRTWLGLAGALWAEASLSLGQYPALRPFAPRLLF